MIRILIPGTKILNSLCRGRFFEILKERCELRRSFFGRGIGSGRNFRGRISGVIVCRRNENEVIRDWQLAVSVNFGHDFPFCRRPKILWSRKRIDVQRNSLQLKIFCHYFGDKLLLKFSNLLKLNSETVFVFKLLSGIYLNSTA